MGISAVLAFYLGHITADFSWDTALSTLLGSGLNLITPRIYRFLIFVCGVFLVYLGFIFLSKGLSSIV
jgi:threonine/homoserine/homoserine lactone efflux protein